MLGALALVAWVFVLARHTKRGADRVFWFAFGVAAMLLAAAVVFGSSFDSPRAKFLGEVVVSLLRAFTR
jgi:bacteriorhodopsin